MDNEEERSRRDHPAGKKRTLEQHLDALLPVLARESQRFGGPICVQTTYADGSWIEIAYEPAAGARQ